MSNREFWREAAASARNSFLATMSENVVLTRLESVIADLSDTGQSAGALQEVCRP